MKKIIFIIALLSSSIFIISCSNKQAQQPNNTDSGSINIPTPTPITAADNSILNNTENVKGKVSDAPVKKSADDLCSKDEDVLLSFKIADSDKSASVCISKNQQDYIIYRFGTKDKIELEYPEKTEKSWKLFTYSYYLRGGGAENEGLDLNHLSFNNGGYTYQIYEEYSSESDKPTIGINVTNQKTNKETNIIGDSDSIKGSLIGLRENSKINTATE